MSRVTDVGLMINKDLTVHDLTSTFLIKFVNGFEILLYRTILFQFSFFGKHSSWVHIGFLVPWYLKSLKSVMRLFGQSVIIHYCADYEAKVLAIYFAMLISVSHGIIVTLE